MFKSLLISWLTLFICSAFAQKITGEQKSGTKSLLISRDLNPPKTLSLTLSPFID